MPFRMLEITPFVYNSGTVVTYTVLGNSQQTLPYVRHYENPLETFGHKQ